MILKITPVGDTLWWRVIESNSIDAAFCCAPTDDGGCIIVGDGDTNYAARINSNGTIRWIKYYGAQDLINYDIKKTKNGRYIFCGSNISRIGCVTMIDSSGNLLWEKFYSGGFSLNLRTVLNSTDNEFVLFGTVKKDKFDTTKVLIMSIDSSGKIIWEKINSIFKKGASLLKADVLNNGYILGGTTIDTLQILQGVSFFAKTDFYGNILYSKAFYGNQQEYFYDIKKINENRYVMAVTSQVSNLNAKVYITDSVGTIIYKKLFPNNLFNAFRSILPLSNGDIVLAGIFEFGFSFPERDIYVVRTDSMLNSPPLAILNNEIIIPQEFTLFQNYPNPFNPKTIISYVLPKYEFVKIKIYDIMGRELFTLVNELKQAGSYSLNFDGQNLASGIYIYKMEAGRYTETRRMVLIK